MGDPAGGVHYGKGDPGPFLMVDSGGFGGCRGSIPPCVETVVWAGHPSLWWLVVAGVLKRRRSLVRYAARVCVLFRVVC